MCFSTPKVSSTPIAAAPTAVNTGETEAMQESKKKDRERQRAASGFQQNILSGTTATGTTDTSGTKKQLLGQ